MHAFPTLMTAMATPFDADGGLDLDGVQSLASHLVDHGSQGLVVAGTTGESPTLSHDETLETFRAVVEAVGERVTVVAGTGKNDTAATIQLTQHAEKVGVDAIMLVTPYYSRPSQAGLDRHFRACAAATDLPVLLYNIPSRTACEIEPETLIGLADDIDNIMGVKDAVGDLVKTSWVVSHAPDDFGVYSGDDANCLPLLAVGGVGLVSVAAHLVGEQLAEMIGVFETDPAVARSIHLRCLPLFRALFAEPSPGPLKAGLKVLGLPGGEVRLPLAMPRDSTVAGMVDAMRAAGVEV